MGNHKGYDITRGAGILPADAALAIVLSRADVILRSYFYQPSSIAFSDLTFTQIIDNNAKFWRKLLKDSAEKSVIFRNF